MNEMSEAVQLIAAYRVARCSVRLHVGRRVVLRVGDACPSELAQVLACTEAGLGALITAWNPFSRPAARDENHRRQRQLLDCLRSEGARVLVGAGGGAGWREPGLAAFGVHLAALDALARRFAQNAILTFSAETPVRLRLYRDDWRDALAGADVDFAPDTR